MLYPAEPQPLVKHCYDNSFKKIALTENIGQTLGRVSLVSIANMEQSKFIFELIRASDLLEQQPNLEAGLREVARMTAQILDTQRCSIMLLADEGKENQSQSYLRVFTHYGHLSQSAYTEVVQLNQGIAGYVAATGQPLLIADITQSRFVSAARYSDEKNKSLISVPIMLSNKVIGVINVSSPTDGRCFEGADLEQLKLFSLYVGKSIQAVQLQNILKSRFVEMAIAQDYSQTSDPGAIVNPQPGKLTKIVAKSLFKELTNAGFGANQIINISTEVLNLLQENLDKKS